MILHEIRSLALPVGIHNLMGVMLVLLVSKVKKVTNVI